MYNLAVSNIHGDVAEVFLAVGVEQKVAGLKRRKVNRYTLVGLSGRRIVEPVAEVFVNKVRESGAVSACYEAPSAVYIGISDKLERVGNNGIPLGCSLVIDCCRLRLGSFRCGTGCFCSRFLSGLLCLTVCFFLGCTGTFTGCFLGGKCSFVFLLRAPCGFFRRLPPCDFIRFFFQRNRCPEFGPKVQAFRVDETGTRIVGFDFGPSVFGQFLDIDLCALLGLERSGSERTRR